MSGAPSTLDELATFAMIARRHGVPLRLAEAILDDWLKYQRQAIKAQQRAFRELAAERRRRLARDISC